MIVGTIGPDEKDPFKIVNIIRQLTQWQNITGLGAPREILSVARSYYVRTDGSNSNNGLSNSVGGAFLTLQKALDALAGSIDTAGNDVTITVADGTYTTPVVIKPWVGGGSLSLVGNTTTPANCVISTTSADAINHSLGALPGKVVIKGFKLTTATAGYGMQLVQAGRFDVQNMDFGAVAAGYAQCLVKAGTQLNFTDDYNITGGGGKHLYVSTGGQIAAISGVTVTISGGLTFANSFAEATGGGNIYGAGYTFAGSSFTGKRFDVNMNGQIDVQGAGVNFFPGSIAGTPVTGGQYV